MPARCYCLIDRGCDDAVHRILLLVIKASGVFPLAGRLADLNIPTRRAIKDQLRNCTMFQVDRARNRLKQPDRITFSEVGLREREHFQEWLASTPDVLGEHEQSPRTKAIGELEKC